MTTGNGQRTRAILCVPVCVRRVSELRALVARAAEVADIVELRLDCLADEGQLEAALRDLGDLLHTCPRPIMLTFRPAEQGGQRALDIIERVGFWLHRWAGWAEGARRYPTYADVELDLFESAHAPKLYDIEEHSTLLCSHHDFVGVPADLEAIYERMTRTPARVLKLAVQTDEITDCLILFRLLKRARREGRELIAVGMGAAGLITRILAPARGAFLTYGALDEQQATAPGQITAQELRDLYRVHTLDAQTEVFGLVGAPVMHSVSPHMHNAAFAATRRNAVYIPLEVRDVTAFVRRMAHPRTRELNLHLRGLSITAPHKQTIMPQLDFIEPAAQEIGAVNTIVFADDALHGYNTDAAAALAPLTGMIKLDGARVAVIGAGGAARSVLWGLQRAGANVTVYARDVARAQSVADLFGARCAALAGAEFPGCALVINTTPLGTRGHAAAETPATAAQLRGAHAVYDLVYNPAETRFMREARAAGCAHVLGGLAMLVTQAVAAFELWTGQPAPIDAMRAAAEKRLLDVRC
ncbi:MAG: shikimate dehydrogenase [Pyrinomonadaceae bacterium]